MREEALVAPGVAGRELIRDHVLGPEDHVRRVIARPVLVQQAPLALHPIEERRSRIGGQDVERGALEPVVFHPRRRPLEDVGTVVVETEDEARVHLDAVVVQERDAARVVIGPRALLARLFDVLRLERLEADEDARAPGEGHLADGSYVGPIGLVAQLGGPTLVPAGALEDQS